MSLIAMTELGFWRAFSVAALAALWFADLVVLVLEFRKDRRGPLFWWSLVGIVFLGLLTVSDGKLARLEDLAERRNAPRHLSAEQSAALKAELSKRPGNKVIVYYMPNAESQTYGLEIVSVITHAGWQVTHSTLLGSGAPHVGVAIEFGSKAATPDPTQPGRWNIPIAAIPPAAVALFAAFEASGISFERSSLNQSLGDGLVDVTIGDRPL
jgi:hypothetical protein